MNYTITPLSISIFTVVLIASLFSPIVPLYGAITGNVQSARVFRNKQMAVLVDTFQRAIPADAWKTTVDPTTGEAKTVVNKTHSGYKKAFAEFEAKKQLLDSAMDSLDSKRRITFNAMAEELANQKKIVNTGGKTENLQSDYDWTFKSADDAKVLFKQLEDEGYKPKWDASGRYFDCPEADIKAWVPHEQARLGTKQYMDDVKASAANVEIGNNEGELRYLTKDNQYLKSDEGAILGNVKKKAMSTTLSSAEDGVYTEFKTIRKILAQDGSYQSNDASSLGNDELHKTLKAFEDRKTSMEAFDDLSTPEDHRREKRSRLRAVANTKIIEAFKKAAIKGAEIDARRLKKAADLDAQARKIVSNGGDMKRARDLLNRAQKLTDGVKRTSTSNSLTLQVIAKHDPSLAMKLNLERVKARASLKNPDSKVDPADVKAIKQATDSMKTRKIAGTFLKNAQFLQKDLGKLESVADFTGIIGGACEEIEQELDAAAREGRNVSMTNVAANLGKGTGVSLTVKVASKKLPVVGQIFELATMPKQIAENLYKNQQKRIDEFEEKYGAGHEFEAKLYASFDTFKDVTCISSAERAIEKVAKEEYDLVANGEAEPSSLRYYGKVAAESVLEISKINSGIRFGTEAYYGVKKAETEATISDRNFRNAVNINVHNRASKMTAIREEINRLEITYGDDNPKAKQRMNALESMYDGEKKGISDLAKRMHRTHGGWDTQTRTIRDKLITEKLLRETDKIQKKISVIAGSGQTDSARVFDDLIEQREKLHQKTNELWNRVNNAQDLYGKNAPHVLALRDTLRQQKAFLAKVNKIDGKTPLDPWPVPDNFKKAVEKYKTWDYHVKVDDKGANRKRFIEDQARRTVFEQFRSLEADGMLPPGVSARDAFEAHITAMYAQNKLSGDGQSSTESLDGSDEAPDSTGGKEPGDDISASEETHEGDDRSDKAGDESNTDDESDDDSETDDDDEAGDASSTEAELKRLEALSEKWPEPGSTFHSLVECVEPLPPVPYSDDIKIMKTSTGIITRKYSLLNGNSHGLDVRWRTDGTKQSETSLLAGVKHGPTRRYSQMGKPHEEQNYKKGKKHGPFRLWHENGKPRSESSYKDDEKHGPFRTWNKDGFKTSEEFYRDGELIQSQKWSPVSKKIAFETFVDESTPGTTKAFLSRTYDKETGHLTSQTSRNSKGNLHGTQIRHETPESIRYTTTYEDGILLVGKQELGPLTIQLETYEASNKKSVRHGFSKKWFSTGPNKGKERYVVHYSHGKPHGNSLQAIERNNKIIILQEGRWSNGLKDGRWIFRDQNQHTKYELNLALGYPSGAQKFYDKEGSLSRIVTVSGKNQSMVKLLTPTGTNKSQESGVFSPEKTGSPGDTGENAPQKMENGIFSYYDSFNRWCPQGCGYNTLVTGTRYEWFTSGPGNGKPFKETHLKDKKLHGIQREWYPNGTIKTITGYASHEKDGPYIVYGSDGNVSVKTTYKKGFVDGNYIRYFSADKVLCNIPMKNGVIHGEYVYNHNNEQASPRNRGTVTSGYISRWWTEFDRNGKIIMKSHNIPGEQAVEPRKDVGYGATIPFPQARKHGPIYSIKNGSVKWSFARQGKDGKTQWTDNPKEYYRIWVKEDSSLPLEIPGVPKPPIPREAPLTKIKPKGFDPSSFPHFPPDLSKEKAYEKLMEAWGKGNAGGEQAVIPLLQALENIEMYGHRRNAVATTHEKLVAVYSGLERWDRALYHALEAKKVWIETNPDYDSTFIDRKIRLCERAGAED